MIQRGIPGQLDRDLEQVKCVRIPRKFLLVKNLLHNSLLTKNSNAAEKFLLSKQFCCLAANSAQKVTKSISWSQKAVYISPTGSLVLTAYAAEMSTELNVRAE